MLDFSNPTLPGPITIFFGILFSVAGIGYITFGRKQSPLFLTCGICLMVLSFFELSLTTYVLSGIILLIVPFFIEYYLS